MTGKPALRQQMREVLSSLTAVEKSTASRQLCAQLRAWPVFRDATTIALFHPTATEPDLLPLLDLPEKRFLFPKCQPGWQITWHRPEHLSQWRPSRFGIIEPDPALDPAVDAGAMGLVLVPGLAFTTSGDRLGHGAGYYDRFLHSLAPSITTAGLCFSCQIPARIPREAHDVKVHYLFHA